MIQKMKAFESENVGGDDYSDAGIIDATDPRGYGYGVTYGKSRKSGIYNERRGKMSGSIRRKTRKSARSDDGSRIVRQARKEGKGRR